MANETLTEPENFAEPVARDPRSAWLPESMTMKIINMNEAIKNYCAAELLRRRERQDVLRLLPRPRAN